MRLHTWAADALWHGLVVPSDDQWIHGAHLIANATIDVSAMMHAKPNAEVVELAEQLEAFAARAEGTRGLEQRAALYGDMLRTCASCHAIVRPSPVYGDHCQ